MTRYAKALPAGISSVTVWDGTNLDAFITAAGAGNVTYINGELKVFTEIYQIGDALYMNDDEPPAFEEHATAAAMEADLFYLDDAVEYDGTNADDIMVFVGRDAHYRGEVLYVKDTALTTGDRVAKHRTMLIPRIDEATFEATYS